MKGARILLSLLLAGCFLTELSAQQSAVKKPLTIFLNDENTHWVKFSVYFQLWARVTQQNPGTTVFGKPEPVTYDLSMRRFRFAIQSQPIDRLFVYLQLGKNNLNYLSPRGTPIDLLDGQVEYRFSRAFHLGGGKSGWDGLSRYTSPSASSAMAYDLAFVALPTLDATDDLIRKLSIYAKGKLGKLDYRFVLAKPFSVRNSSSFDPIPVEGIATFADRAIRAQLAGYFKYEFWESESNNLPYHAGTYLGAKKVLNLGAGFLFQDDALWSLENGDTVLHNLSLFAVDAFLDLPTKQC